MAISPGQSPLGNGNSLASNQTPCLGPGAGPCGRAWALLTFSSFSWAEREGFFPHGSALPGEASLLRLQNVGLGKWGRKWKNKGPPTSQRKQDAWEDKTVVGEDHEHWSSTVLSPGSLHSVTWGAHLISLNPKFLIGERGMKTACTEQGYSGNKWDNVGNHLE